MGEGQSGVLFGRPVLCHNPGFKCPQAQSCTSVSCRFAKNLSPDKINLSTLKGEGQLTNLELDEEVLQSLLDLPTWLAINRVCCNKAAIRVRDTGTDLMCSNTKSTYRSASCFLLFTVFMQR